MNDIAEEGHCKGSSSASRVENHTVELLQWSHAPIRSLDGDVFSCGVVRLRTWQALFGILVNPPGPTQLTLYDELHLLVARNGRDSEWMSLQWRQGVTREKDMLAGSPRSGWMINGDARAAAWQSGELSSASPQISMVSGRVGMAVEFEKVVV